MDSAGQWKALRISNGLQGKVHVQIGPIKMMGVKQLHIHKPRYGHILEPRKIREGQEQFLPVHQQPKAVFRHISDFNARSVFSKQRGFHLRVSE